MTSNVLRYKLYDYIKVADEKKLRAIYDLLEEDIEAATEWWKDKQFVAELDARYEALKSGEDKGVTLDELKDKMDNERQKRYGK